MRPHETVMVENIIMIEWDISQILIQKRRIAMSAIFDEIIKQYVNVARKIFSKGERQKRLKALGENADIFESLNYGN